MEAGYLQSQLEVMPMPGTPPVSFSRPSPQALAGACAPVIWRFLKRLQC